MNKQIDLVELLKKYRVYKRFIDSEEYAKEYFDYYDTQQIDKKDQYEAKINVIESLISFLEPSDEYTLLYLHYIKGIGIEKCSECMYLSTRTAYRLLNKAHEKLFDFVNKKGETNERN